MLLKSGPKKPKRKLKKKKNLVMNENRNSLPKYMGQSKSTFKREIIAIQGYL